jgi:hypothetical protein
MYIDDNLEIAQSGSISEEFDEDENDNNDENLKMNS